MQYSLQICVINTINNTQSIILIFFQTNIFQPQNPSKLGTEMGLPGLKLLTSLFESVDITSVVRQQFLFTNMQ